MKNMNSKNMNNKNMNKNFKKATSSHHFHFHKEVKREINNEDPMKEIKDALSSASEDQILDEIQQANVESWCDLHVRTVDHNADREIGVISRSHVSLENGLLFIATNVGSKKMSIRIPFKAIRSCIHFAFKVMNAYVAFSELLTSLTENFTKEMKSFKSEIKFYKNF